MIFFRLAAIFILMIYISPVFGKLVVNNEPATIITTGLIKPEEVAFSPSGNCIAIASALNNSIVIFKRIGNTSAKITRDGSCLCH